MENDRKAKENPWKTTENPRIIQGKSKENQRKPTKIQKKIRGNQGKPWYDINEYELYRGFLYDYHKVTPGPKPKKLDSFLEELRKALNGDLGANYKEIKNQFHLFQDANSSKRVLDEISKLINE